MKPETAVDKVIQEMQSQNMFPAMWVNEVKRYLYMTYCIGFDEGNRVRSNRKKVYQYNKFGQQIAVFESAAQAHRVTQVARTCIMDCCNDKQNTAGGYIWKYEHNKRNIAYS
jgi:hypothetical protein